MIHRALYIWQEIYIVASKCWLTQITFFITHHNKMRRYERMTSAYFKLNIERLCRKCLTIKIRLFDASTLAILNHDVSKSKAIATQNT